MSNVHRGARKAVFVSIVRFVRSWHPSLTSIVFFGFAFATIPSSAAALSKAAEVTSNIVSRMDLAEALSFVRAQFWILAGFVGATLALIFLVLLVLVRRRLESISRQNRAMEDWQRRQLEAETMYRQIIEQAIDYAITSLDAEGRVITWNSGAQRIQGYEGFEVLGESFDRFFPEEERQGGRPESLLQEAREKGRVVDEGWCLRKDGSRFWANITITALHDNVGRLVGYSKITRDITSRKEAEDQVRNLTILYETLSQVNQAIVRASSEEGLFGEIVRVCVEFGRFDLAWIGLPDEERKQFRIIAAEGPCIAYVDGIAISMDPEQITGRGPTGTAYREMRPVITQDWDMSPSVMPWISRAEIFGLSSSASFPLLQDGKTKAVLNIYSRQKGYFREDRMRLLGEMTTDVEFALDKLAEARRRLASDAERERLLEMLDEHARRLESLVDARTAHLTRLTKAIEQSPASVVITDNNGLIEYVNPKFLKITGYSEKEVLGKSPSMLRSDVMSESFYRDLRDTIIAGKEWSGEFCNRAKDGHLIWEHASISPIFDSEGAITQFVAVKDDITERKVLEEDLKQTGQRLRLVLDSASDGIFGVGIDGNCTFINRSALIALGYDSPEEIIGKNDHEFFYRAFVGDAAHMPDDCPICRVLHGENSGRIDDEAWRRKDGGLIPVEYEARALMDGDAIGGAVVTFSDITERKRHEETLVRAIQTADSANRAKSAFLANMSHEIRTPMNAVLGYAQLLQRGKGLSARQTGYIDSILRAGDHLLELINMLLDLSRIESGHASLSENSFDLYRFTEDLIIMFRIQAEAKELSLACNFDPDIPRWVYGDEGKLRQILINLLGNAIKFTASGEVIMGIHAGELGQPAQKGSMTLTIEVSDTGPGIAADELERLFGAFEQTALGASKGGAGLGLAISRQLARIMGGEVEAFSEPGKGSIFRLSIVMGAGQAIHEGGISQSPLRIREPSRDYRILVVDDREENRVIFREMLGAVGFITREASSGEEALGIFEAWRPDVVIMDVLMPGMNGLEAIRRMKASEPGRCSWIIASSASALDFNQREALDAGADSFLSKPLRETELLDALRKVLALEYDEPQKESRKVPPTSELVDMSPLGEERAFKMREAAAEADYDELLSLIASAEADSLRTASFLRAFMEKYDYRGLIDFLDAEEASRE